MGFFDDAVRNIGNFFGVNTQQKKPVQKQPTKTIPVTTSQTLRAQAVPVQAAQTVQVQTQQPINQIKSTQQIQQAKPAAQNIGSKQVFPDANATADQLADAFNSQGKITTNTGTVLDFSNPQTRENIRKVIQNTQQGKGNASQDDKDKAAYLTGKLDNSIVANVKQTANATAGFAGNLAKVPVDVAQGAGKAAVRIAGGLANKDSVDVGPVGGAILGEQNIKGISQYGRDIVSDTGKIIGKNWSGAPQWVKDAVGVAATVSDATPGLAGANGAVTGVKTGIKSGAKEGAAAFSDAIGATKTTDAVSKLFTKAQPNDPAVIQQAVAATGNTPATVSKVAEKVQNDIPLTPEETQVAKDVAQTTTTPKGIVSNNALGALANGNAAAANKILDGSGIALPKDAKTQLAEQLGLAKTPAEAQDVFAHAGIQTDAPARVKKSATTEQIASANDALPRIMDGTATKADTTAFNKVYGPAQKAKALDRATTAPGDRIPESAIPDGAGFKTNKMGEQVPIKNYGEAGAGGAEFQRDLENSPLTKNVDNAGIRYVRNVEQNLRPIREADPVLAKHADDLIDSNIKAVNDAADAKNAGVTTLNESTNGFKKQDWADTQAILENYSNAKRVASIGNDKAKAAADSIRPVLKDIIDRLNPVLKENGLQEIGRVEDYFPRMQQLNRSKNLSKDIAEILGSSDTQAGMFGNQGLSRGFLKERTLEEQAGKALKPRDALVRYISQAEDLIHTLPVYRRAQAMTEWAKETTNAPEPARKAILGILDQFKSQYDNATGKTAAQRGTQKLVNFVSRTQIAGSVSTALTAVANPVFGAVNNALKRGLIRGGADSIAAVVHGLYKVPLARAGKVKEFASIDGMESQYLKSLISSNPAAKGFQKVQNAGYALSNTGDAPYRAGFLEQRYRVIRSEDNKITPEAALRQAEQDTRNVFGSRVKGERSKFTSSPNVIPKLASQYQVEQIANAMSVLDGLMNSKVPANRKLAAAITGLGAAYGANQLTSAISGGTVKPVPDLVGSFVDALDKVNRDDSDRKNKGEKGLSDAEKVGLIFSNTGSNFVSNLPLGRTVLSTASSAAQGLGLKDDVATETGLTPRDTNPAQTLPAIGTVADTISAAQKVGQGKDTLANGIVTVGSKFVPFGSQARKSIQGVATFINGGQTAQPTQAQKDNGQPGTQKFTVNNDLSTTEGKVNLLQMALFGPYAGSGGQGYIKSGFQSQSDRDIANKKFTSEDVGNMTQDQANQYFKSVKTRFGNSLSDADKAVYKIYGKGQDEVNRQINAGKITQDQVDHIKAQLNRNLYDNGLGYKIDTGYSADDLNKLSDPEKAWVIQKAIDTKGLYDEDKQTKESKAVVDEALKDDVRWPTLDPADFAGTNKLAKKYIDYQKKLADAGDDDSAKFEAQKAFWTNAVKGTYADKDQSNYKLSIDQIKQMVGSDGLTINGKQYKLNKDDLDTMIAMDDKLLKAGLISTPKFSNKTRKGFGYGEAPESELDGIGYVDTSKSKGGGSGGSAKEVNSHAGDFLTDTKVSPLFKQSASSSAAAAPKADFSKFRNKAGVARGSSIKIKL